MKQILFTTLLLCLSFSGFAQQKYWVIFKDKKGSEMDPYSFYDAKAIERRQKHNVPLVTYSDLPVPHNYIQEVLQVTDSIKMISRWMNGVVVFLNKNQVSVIEKLEMVEKVFGAESEGRLSGQMMTSYEFGLSSRQKELAKSQIELMGGHYFDQNDIKGRGVRVAIFDAGFPNADEAKAFEHIYERKGVLKTFDFVKGKENVYRSNAHGTMTFSNIGGKVDGTNLGMATEAEFLLAKTEKGLSEKVKEEENWLAAAEWADQNGADIINSSLGYTFHRHFQEHMDGKTSVITLAANMAASKGILVVNSAGNEGDAEWTIMGAPADADSVLTVGGFDPWTTLHSSFGSFGPTADGRLKPNIVAPSTAVAQGKNSFSEVDGTSFSSPLTAGFAACLMEMYPQKTNMEIFQMILESGHLYPYFDYAHGHGVPQAWKFFNDSTSSEATFKVDTTTNKNRWTVEIDEKHLERQFFQYVSSTSNSFSVIRTLSENQYGSPQNTIIPYFYYHIFDDNSGKILKYEILSVQQQKVLEISPKSGRTYRFHYKGYTHEIQF